LTYLSLILENGIRSILEYINTLKIFIAALELERTKDHKYTTEHNRLISVLVSILAKHPRVGIYQSIAKHKVRALLSQVDEQERKKLHDRIEDAVWNIGSCKLSLI
jgi:hypothetical protein